MAGGNLVVAGGRLITPYEVCDGTLIIREGIITYAGPAATAPSATGRRLEVDGAFVVPGFVDIHVHGGGGASVMDGTVEALEQMARTHGQFGTTSLVPTTVTAPHEQLVAATEAVKRAVTCRFDGAQILGLHMEGPYINPAKRGAQNPAYVRQVNREELEGFYSRLGHFLRMVTLAPECSGAESVIPLLCKWGVTVSIGHSDASYSQIMAAARWGASHVAHTFNAMRGLHHREPGTVGAALVCDGLTAELIADGIHVHPAVMQLLIRCKGVDRVVLITDAMEAMGLAEGTYQLGGMEVIVRQGAARLVTGELAGSTLSLGQAVRNVVHMLGVPLPAAVQMASLNPARVIGVGHRKGSLSVGKDGDIAILDQSLQVVATVVQGQVIYDNI